MASVLSPDSPTATTCPACQGRRVRSVELATGDIRREPCSWCEGCGFVLPERYAEWRTYEQRRNGVR